MPDKVVLVDDIAGEITPDDRLSTESQGQISAGIDKGVKLLLERECEVGDTKEGMMLIDSLRRGKSF